LDKPLLKLENVNLKIDNFALSNINLDLYGGEIHVIMGENRSGKTLLMQIVSGMLSPNAGRFFLDGKEMKYNEYSSHIKNIITYARQESEMLTNLTIAENLFFNNMPYKNRILQTIDYDKLNYMCQELLKELNLPISIYDKVSSLGLAQRQICEFLRAYVSKSKIVILDEPFAALTQGERELLCKVVKGIREKGVGIFYITHSLDDVFQLGDRITIIKDGRIVDTRNVSDCTREEIIKLMSGHYIQTRYPKIKVKTGNVILSVKDLCFEDKLQNINFDLRQGEILGVTGLAGSGRTLLAKCLFGAVDNVQGRIYINGSEVKITDPHTAISNGIALIPEDRINYSIFSYLTVSDNISVSSLKRFAHLLKIDVPILMHSVMEYIKKLNITQHPSESILQYSSGNQQKAVFAKWIMSRAKIFILDEPTRGLDIASKIDIYNFINDLVKKDVGVIFISSDIEEILGICDRVAVLSSRTLACDVSTRDITVERIMELATREDI